MHLNMFAHGSQDGFSLSMVALCLQDLRFQSAINKQGFISCLHIAMATIQTKFVVHYGNKKWEVPKEFVYTWESHDSKQWLQVRASNYGLVNLVSKDSIAKLNQPSLNQSPGLLVLLKLRNEASGLIAPPDLLAEDDEEAKPTKKRKRITANQEEHLVINLEDANTLTVKRAKKVSDDLAVEFNEGNSTTFFDYVVNQGVKVCTKEDKRSYKKSGQFVGKCKKQKAKNELFTMADMNKKEKTLKPRI